MFTCSAISGAMVLVLASAAATSGPDLGEPLNAARVAQLDRTVLADGRGLPPGSGTPEQGRRVFEAWCQACHGAAGRDGPNDALVSTADGATPAPRTVGSYWPYATTVFDYVRRAMPYQSPGSLSDDDVYAVTAYLLHLNGIIDADARLDANTLPEVRMPNREAFVIEYPPTTP